MNRHHLLRYCALNLLILSCRLLAQGEAQNIDEARIRTVVKEYFQTLQQGRNADVVALSCFLNEREQNVFLENMRKRGAVNQWDTEQEFHVVQAKRYNDHIRTLLLLPTKRGYFPDRIFIREIGGTMKVIPAQSVKHKDLSLDIVSSKVDELKESLQGWRLAKGTALTEKISILKVQLLEEIDALEYAVMNQLHVAPEYGDLVTRRNIYNEIKDLSDEDLRSKLIEEIESALETLSP